LAVESVTSSKKDTLILNVDGAIAVSFVDLLRSSGAFSREEADEYMSIGTLNALFVLGRSIGFIGHHLDQKRLKAGLYRHPAGLWRLSLLLRMLTRVLDDIFIDLMDQSRELSHFQQSILADFQRRGGCPAEEVIHFRERERSIIMGYQDPDRALNCSARSLTLETR
jgi:hypothetical protein